LNSFTVTICERTIGAIPLAVLIVEGGDLEIGAVAGKAVVQPTASVAYLAKRRGRGRAIVEGAVPAELPVARRPAWPPEPTVWAVLLRPARSYFEAARACQHPGR
jgi:hypothetical protein